MKYLAKNLVFLREREGLKQREISLRLGFNQSTWNNYERGVSKPGLDDFIKIIRFFKTTASKLLEEDLTKSDFSQKNEGSKKGIKYDHSSDYDGDLYAKKLPNPDILSQVNEDENDLVLNYRMPKVITVDSQGNENVIMVPVKARAGYLSGYSDPEFISQLPAYRIPGLNNGTFRIFEVEGLSMYPTLHSADLVIGSYVEQLGLLRDDRVHVVVTKNEGIVVKRVLNRIKTDGKLILKSDNYKDRDQYPPIVCDPQDIIEIWYATGYISKQMKPPAEIYNRLIDLEGRFTILEQNMKKSGK